MEQTQNVAVNLPSATQAAADFKPGIINIAVDKNGQIWLEKHQISPNDLTMVLSNRFRLDTNLPVYVSGDKDTLEGAISDVLQIVRKVGAQKVAFMVGDRTEGTP